MTTNDPNEGIAKSRVVDWSARIHGRDNERHAWAIAAVEAIYAGELPEPFSTPYRATRASRLETVVRIMGLSEPTVHRLVVQLRDMSRHQEADAVASLL